MQTFAAIAKALGDEGRVRIIRALANEPELCACQLTELLGLTPSTVSKHLGILRNVGLIKSRKDGTWIFYALDRESEDPVTTEWIDFAIKTMRNDLGHKKDKELLKAIKKQDPEKLCQKQRCRA